MITDYCGRGCKSTNKIKIYDALLKSLHSGCCLSIISSIFIGIILVKIKKNNPEITISVDEIRIFVETNKIYLKR